MPDRPTWQPDPGEPAASWFTTVALFDDLLDAEHALIALRRSRISADQVSLIRRERELNEDDPLDGLDVGAKAIAASSLDTVGAWLHGLTSLTVPGRAIFLAAGPLGIILAEHSVAAATGGQPPHRTTRWLRLTLTEFGFGRDAANYLEHRIMAGAPLIAVTGQRTDQLKTARQLFANHNAVHIGLAPTDARIATAAAHLLVTGTDASIGGDSVVNDMVAPLRKLCGVGRPTAASSLCGQRIIDPDHRDVGTVEEVLAVATGDSTPGHHHNVVRYLVVRYGGVLGLGRRFIAVPVGLFELEKRPLEVAIRREVLYQAPRYFPDFPFSRREELVVNGYFNVTPYWLDGVDSRQNH